ncbi:hypothetical protein DFH29DRAFT_1069287 [Suillus ampliporus]|nr:hypothetical protein DFH29DRAFT_1069287 [Suillus ampliporus]
MASATSCSSGFSQDTYRLPSSTRIWDPVSSSSTDVGFGSGNCSTHEKRYRFLHKDRAPSAAVLEQTNEVNDELINSTFQIFYRLFEIEEEVFGIRVFNRVFYIVGGIVHVVQNHRINRRAEGRSLSVHLDGGFLERRSLAIRTVDHIIRYTQPEELDNNPTSFELTWLRGRVLSIDKVARHKVVNGVHVEVRVGDKGLWEMRVSTLVRAGWKRWALTIVVKDVRWWRPEGVRHERGRQDTKRSWIAVAKDEVAFSGTIPLKKKADLQGIALALHISDAGTRDGLQGRIKSNINPDDPTFSGLYEKRKKIISCEATPVDDMRNVSMMLKNPPISPEVEPSPSPAKPSLQKEQHKPVPSSSNMSSYKSAAFRNKQPSDPSESKFYPQVPALQELFPLGQTKSSLNEVGGDIEVAVTRISEGHAEQWGSVTRKKDKKTPVAQHVPSKDPSISCSDSRGGRGPAPEDKLTQVEDLTEHIVDKPELNEGWSVAQEPSNSTPWGANTGWGAASKPPISSAKLPATSKLLPQEKVVAASPPAPAAPSAVHPAPESIFEHPPPPPAVDGDVEPASEGLGRPNKYVWVSSQPLPTSEPEPVPEPPLIQEEPAAPAPEPVALVSVSVLPAQIQKQDAPTRSKSPVSLFSRHAVRGKYKGIDQAAVMPLSTGFMPGLEKIGMQFGSLSLGGDVIEPTRISTEYSASVASVAASIATSPSQPIFSPPPVQPVLPPSQTNTIRTSPTSNTNSAGTSTRFFGLRAPALRNSLPRSRHIRLSISTNTSISHNISRGHSRSTSHNTKFNLNNPQQLPQLQPYAAHLHLDSPQTQYQQYTPVQQVQAQSCRLLPGKMRRTSSAPTLPQQQDYSASMSGGMGPFGQIRDAASATPDQGSHLSGFGGSEYYSDNQRGPSYLLTPASIRNLPRRLFLLLRLIRQQACHHKRTAAICTAHALLLSVPQSQYYGAPYNQGYPTPFAKHPAPTSPDMFQHQHQPSKQNEGLSMGASMQREFAPTAADAKSTTICPVRGSCMVMGKGSWVVGSCAEWVA